MAPAHKILLGQSPFLPLAFSGTCREAAQWALEFGRSKQSTQSHTARKWGLVWISPSLRKEDMGQC